MCHALLRDANLYGQLLTFDQDLAAEARAAGCGFCGGSLHSARYPRKPRGGLEELGPDYTTRLSFPEMESGRDRWARLRFAIVGPLLDR